MNFYTIAAQTLGIFGMALAVLSFQCKKNRSYFLLQALSGLMFSVHFIMLGAIAGGIMNAINILRGSVFSQGKKGRKWYLYAIIIALYIGATVFPVVVLSDTLWLALVALSAQIVGTSVMWTDKGKLIRWVQLFFISPIWMLYNIFCFSIGGILCEGISMISVAVALIRFRRLPDYKKPLKEGKL